MEETYNVPNVYISDLERLAQKIRGVVGTEDTEVSFEFIIASLFPTSWKNIQEEMNRQYTKGYIQGRLDKERENQKTSYHDTNDDADCYCE
jgi:hypothetical protein